MKFLLEKELSHHLRFFELALKCIPTTPLDLMLCHREFYFRTEFSQNANRCTLN